MRQALHLLIVRARTGEALAAQYGSRWLLPIITCEERTRADPKVVRWSADRNIECDVVGQWLGCAHPPAIDWLMVLKTVRGDRPSEPHLMWTPLDTLISKPALIEYQSWAVRRVMAQSPLPSMSGPFGRLDWLDEVNDWIRAAVGEQACRQIRQFRTSAHEVVLSARTTRGDVYFKGLAHDRACEPMITGALASIAPQNFAETLALEERGDGSIWWLTTACSGQVAHDCEPVGRALAHVQRRAMGSAEILENLAQLDLDAALTWVRELVDERCASAIEQSVRGVLDARVPHTWIPMDLHPTNMLIDADGVVRFIDLDDSFLGPAPLAAALFAKRSRAKPVYAGYEQSWPTLCRVDWAAFEAVAALVEAWLGWQRLERKTRRGEVHGATEIAMARIRQRLSSALQRR